MKISTMFSRAAVAAYLAATVLAALPVSAAGQVYASDHPFTVNGYAFKVMAGSEADSFALTSGGFSVTVATGEAFIVRSSIEAPLPFENDAGLAPCNVLQNQENQLVINGPRTVNVTISGTSCSKQNYSTNNTTLLTVSQPNGGETLAAGAQYMVFWQVTGGAPAAVSLRLSVDGGVTYPTTIFANQISNGYYTWTVPSIPTTSHARLMLQAIDQGNVSAVDISDADFTINGIAPAPEPTPSPTPAPAPHPAFDPAAETTAASTIDVDRGFPSAEPQPGTTACQPGSRIKGPSSTAVYYCGQDLKRHGFPNQKIHDSWYSGFSNVVTLTDAQLAAVPLGANVTYRPGVRLVKITTDPKVYAVAKDGTLRWVPDEWTAKKLYGDDWNKKVDDVPDAFFFDYKIGEQVPTQS